MPLGSQVVQNLELNGFIFFFEIWSKHASGQIAFSFEFFHSKKCSIGGVSFLEISFWFPLLIALSGQFFFNDQ
jgi:hypothetical protein